MDTKAKVLDIAMNLNRIGNWAADSFEFKKKRIFIFLDLTSSYLKSLDISSTSPDFQKTFQKFYKTYLLLVEDAKKGPKNTGDWAEQMMTWGNILTHRSKLM